jgi:hypothetical protein
MHSNEVCENGDIGNFGVELAENATSQALQDYFW